MKTELHPPQDVLAIRQRAPLGRAAERGSPLKDNPGAPVVTLGSASQGLETSRAAQRVRGSHALAVEKAARRSESGQRSDAEIAESALNILGWTRSQPAHAVKALVEGGWLTLFGDVAWAHQRLDAADSVRELCGVTGVSNMIAVRRSLSVDGVRAAALRVRDDALVS